MNMLGRFLDQKFSPNFNTKSHSKLSLSTQRPFYLDPNTDRNSCCTEWLDVTTQVIFNAFIHESNKAPLNIK